MKLNDLAILVVLFIIISFVLSAFDIISISLTNILAYSLLVIGIALVYTETIRQNRLSVFLGSLIFLFGIYFLITENFNLRVNNTFYIPIFLIFSGSGLLMLYISSSVQKIFLYFSIILLASGITLVISTSHWRVNAFFISILPVLKFLWPVLIIFVVLIFLMKIK